MSPAEIASRERARLVTILERHAAHQRAAGRRDLADLLGHLADAVERCGHAGDPPQALSCAVCGLVTTEPTVEGRCRYCGRAADLVPETGL